MCRTFVCSGVRTLRNRVLSKPHEEVRPDELVSHLIQEDTSVTPDDTTWVKLELHHKHLPKLAAAGVIDYDRRDETVRYHGGKTLEDAVAFAANIEHSQ
ncbi:DUF7344 domain-containing protein [Haladaptatus sp. NG-SE-30]